MPPRRSCFAAGIARGTPGSWPVSMPPRRSCFRPQRAGQSSNPAVSMPPRRSCFFPGSPGHIGGLTSFNATTAFLLRKQCLTQKSPRRCFNATTAFLLPGFVTSDPKAFAAFQCHHGVPASSLRPRGQCDSKGVSMPPRRSCFLACQMAAGVGRRGFNATTAFLLPA